jgi:hypothetical protein
MNKQEMDKLIQELIECSEGRRGWVNVNTARAKIIGIAHDLLLGSARAFGLKVAPHGRFGWTATRAA